jgi:hypothetical protein
MSVFLILFKSPHDGFGDDGIYIAAGDRVLSGAPIYTNGFRGGTFGATTLFLISKLFNFGSSWLIFQVFSILSVIAIVFLLTRGKDQRFRILASLFVVSSAPVREMLHDHQITSLVIFLSIWPFFFILKNSLLNVLAITSCALAIDLKPHIAIIFIFALGFSKRRFKTLFSAFALCAVFHVAISLFRGENVDLLWIKVILKVNGTGTWGESIFLWPLLEKLSIPIIFLVAAEWLSIIGLLALVSYSALKQNTYLALFSIGFLTYFMSYSHFYDLVLIAALTIVAVLAIPTTLGLVFMGFGIVPGLLFEPRNLVFWITMMLILAYYTRFTAFLGWKKTTTAMLAVYSLHLAMNRFSLSFGDQVRLRSSLYVVLAILALYPWAMKSCDSETKSGLQLD